MNNDILIKTEDLYFAYPANEGEKPKEVIHGINMEIKRGEFVALLGRNGSGKSTLAKLLNMILTPLSGSIYIDGKLISEDMSDDEVLELRRKIGMVFQNPDNQLVATVVEEDIAFGPENMGVEPSQIRRRVDEALETVGMTEFAKHSPHQLSGGQKQRIAIAGILAMMPECIVFDESTAMLDPGGRKDVMNTIERLNRENKLTVIAITHNMEEAILADRVIVIDGGRIEFEGTPREVFSRTAQMKKLGLSVPQVTELAYELSLEGVKMPQGILTEDECAEALMQII